MGVKNNKMSFVTEVIWEGLQIHLLQKRWKNNSTNSVIGVGDMALVIALGVGKIIVSCTFH